MAKNNEEDKNRLNKDNFPRDDGNNNVNIRYMDKVIYTILLNSDNSIKEVINLSNNNIDIDSIKSLGQSILSKNDIKREYIGNIYFNKYSYTYSSGKYYFIRGNCLFSKYSVNQLDY